MNARARRRRRQVDELVDRVAIEELLASQGPVELSPVAIVIAAYKERDNISEVLAGMPKDVCGEPASLLVVVDGEDDGTGAEVRAAGHYACIAPVNRGQGAALRLGYRIAREYGASFIVTSDADGQTDPGDLEVVLEPVVSGRADFVNGSRRLGRTHGTDAVRNLGVVFFAAVISFLTKTPVTDTGEPGPGLSGQPARRARLGGAAIPGAGALDRGDHARLPLRGAARDDARPARRQVKKEREPPLRPPLRPRRPAHVVARTRAPAGSTPGHLRRRGDGLSRPLARR